MNIRDKTLKIPSSIHNVEQLTHKPGEEVLHMEFNEGFGKKDWDVYSYIQEEDQHKVQLMHKNYNHLGSFVTMWGKIKTEVYYNQK